jgi:DNA polymerase-3 subunit epsilon
MARLTRPVNGKVCNEANVISKLTSLFKTASEKTSDADWENYYKQQAQQCADADLRGFYSAGLPGADTPLNQLEFVALDFETTGLNVCRNRIVSIGLVPFTLSRIRPAAGHYWLVDPSIPLSKVSVTIHRITDSEVAGAPPLDNVLAELLQALAGKIVVVHYRQIERGFLDAAVLALRGEHCLFPLIDTMAIEARWARQGMLANMKRTLGLREDSIRLADSRLRYGLPDYSSHHAKVDAMATAELFLAQVARHYTEDTRLGDLWL